MLARRLRRVLKDTEHKFAVGEALGLLGDIILDVGQKFRVSEEVDSAEKGRFALLTLELHSAVTEISSQLVADGGEQAPKPPPPKSLHLTHLK